MTGIIRSARKIVISAVIGSTMPESTPPANERILLLFSAWSGIEIIAPSGKFCIAIPSARANAVSAVVFAVPERYPAYYKRNSSMSSYIKHTTVSFTLSS